MECSTSPGTHWSQSLVLLLNRLSLGGYVLAAGVHKVFHMGVEAFYKQGFLGLKPAWLPEALAQPYGYAIPYLEVALGALLLIGLGTRWVAGIMSAMILSFTIALMLKMGLSGGGPVAFHTNVILVTLAGLLAVMGPGRFSVDGWLACRRRDEQGRPCCH